MGSFYWYDLETTGTDPKWDRIVQFAGLRTNEALEPIGDEACFYVQLAADVLPNPDASLVTGITPQLLASEGIGDWQAMQEIHSLIAQPNTCTVGYNSLRFDDEFVRHGFFRNFLDPYAREWQYGNSRWDLIDLARATGALRREGINWPTDEAGLPVYKLELLTAANGLDHGNAHDALSDVRATVALAQLLKQQQPKLFNYYLNKSNKKAVRALLEPFTESVCLHVSGMYPRDRFSCAPVVALCQHPTNSNSVIVADLNQDISPLLEQNAAALRDSLFAKNSASRPGLKEIRVNRCPFVAPLEVLTEENSERLQIDRGELEMKLKQLQGLQSQGQLQSKIKSVFNGQTFPPTVDVDASLYDGFLTQDDKARSEDLQQSLQQNQWTDLDFSDPRLVELATRLKARSFAEHLSEVERSSWDEFVGAKLQAQDAPWLTLDGFLARIQKLEQTADTQQQTILTALRRYGEQRSNA